jgi:hypothetical protein
MSALDGILPYEPGCLSSCDAPELPLQFVPREQKRRRPAVGAVVRVDGQAPLGQERLHLLRRQPLARPAAGGQR